MSSPSWRGRLTLADLCTAAGVDLSEVLAIRHTFTPDGITGPADLTPGKLLEYTREQSTGNKIGRGAETYWLVFVADGKRRSRLVAVYQNYGVLPDVTAVGDRVFDLVEIDLFAEMRDRVVIQWSPDVINWAKRGPGIAQLPIVEIADPSAVPFPGFDRLVVSYAVLQSIVNDHRYRAWRDVLSSVQGIYLITDTRDGKQYVGKADGAERIFGRWTAYAMTGHGGNVELRRRVAQSAEGAGTFQFSILRVFGPDTPKAEVDAAEKHYKHALLSKKFGMNQN